MKRLIYWLMLLAFSGCNPAPKLGQTIVSVIDSPDSKQQLLIVRQDPGALGARSMAVFVRTKGDRKLGNRVFVVKGEPRIIGRWRNDRIAVITHDGSPQDVFSRSQASGDVQIEYESMPRIDGLHM